MLALKKILQLYGRSPGDIPRYLLAGLLSSDIMGHKHGPHSREVADVLHQFDLFMRDFLALLEMKGIADKTYIIISADHGMHETGKLFKFQEAIEAADVAAKSKDPRDKDYTLYAANRAHLEDLILDWPHDIRAYIQRRVEDAFRTDDGPPTTGSSGRS